MLKYFLFYKDNSLEKFFHDTYTRVEGLAMVAHPVTIATNFIKSSIKYFDAKNIFFSIKIILWRNFWVKFMPGIDNLFQEAATWGIVHHQVGCTTKKIQGNFMLKLPQPFSLEKTICISNYLRNKEKFCFFLFVKKKILKIYAGHSESTISCTWPAVRSFSMINLCQSKVHFKSPVYITCQ